jgi:transposase-like protein
MARESNSRTTELWRSRIRTWRASGLSVAAYCRRIGVSQPSLYQWRRKLESAVEGDRHSGANRARPSPAEFSFLPVQVVGLGNAPLEIVLPNGVVVRVPPGYDRALLRDVVRPWEDEAR